MPSDRALGAAATRDYLARSGLQQLLAKMANAAVKDPESPPASAIEAFQRMNKLREGLSTAVLQLSLGSSPAGSAVLTLSVASALGHWAGSAALRDVAAGAAAWAATERQLRPLSSALAAALRGRDPADQAGCDEAIVAATEKALPAPAPGAPPQPERLALRRAVRLAASLAVARAGAGHTDRELARHLAALAGAWVEPSRKAARAHGDGGPALSFAVVSGAGWFPFRGLHLRCPSTASAPTKAAKGAAGGGGGGGGGSNAGALLAAAMRAAAALRPRLAAASAATNADGTQSPAALAAPANRWESLDALLRPVAEAAAAASAGEGSAALPAADGPLPVVQVVIDLGLPWVSAASVEAERAAAKAANDAFIAANPKAKPPAPPKPAPPAKGAPPPDPKTFWATDPKAVPVSEPEDAHALYVVAQPTPEAVAEAAAAEAAWPGGAGGPFRLALSAPRLVAVLVDAMAAYPALAGLIDPIDAADEGGMRALAARFSGAGGSRGKHNLARVSSTAGSAAFGAALRAGSSLAVAEEAARAAAAAPPRSGCGASVVTPFADCETLTAALALLRAVHEAAGAGAPLVLAHSFALADAESAEADLALAVGAVELQLPAPDSAKSLSVVSRLIQQGLVA